MAASDALRPRVVRPEGRPTYAGQIPARPPKAEAAATVDRLRARLRAGLAIPAHPLALDARRRLDERRQRALARYYLDAGAGGVAVGVHTTQFAIREAGLYEP
ncbi:MAG: hypothetical protein ABI809_08145, partial [Caldimonas sp.]